MPEATPARKPFFRKSGDGWIDCQCGSKHWGVNGAAGLFLIRGHGRATTVLLQHRALWSHQGGTWAVPGGAIMDDETPVHAALREAFEEAGIPSRSVQPVGSVVLDHLDWAYTTVVARFEDETFTVVPTDAESIEFDWVPIEELVSGVSSYVLLPAFKAALPELAALAIPQG